jgi:hypothetical protein
VPTKTLRDSIVASLERRVKSNNNPWGDWSAVSSCNKSDADTTIVTGNNLQGWRKILRDGANATTTMNVEGYDSSAPRGFYAYGIRQHKVDSSLKQEVEFRGVAAVYPLIPTDLNSVQVSSVEDRVRTTFIAKAIKAQQSLQGLTTLGELGKTLRGIRHPLEKMKGEFHRYLRDVEKRSRDLRRFTRIHLRRRGQRRDAQPIRAVDNRVDKMVASVWLEYAFGWKPLIADIDGAAKGLAQYLYGRQPSVRVNAKAENGITSNRFSHTITVSPCVITRIYVQRSVYSARLYGAVVCQANADGAQVRQDFGLGLRDFVPTLWELLPYSFLIDYFTNMGEIIQAAAFNTSSVAWSAYGNMRRVTLEGNADVSYVEPDPASWKGEAWGVGQRPFRVSYFTKHRSASPSLGIPAFSFEIPGFGPKWANITALVAGGRRTSNQIYHYLR